MSNDPPVRARYFTPAEANAELRVVRPLAEQLAELIRSAQGLAQEVGGIGPGEVESHPRASEFLELRSAISSVSRQLTDLGVDVKGVEPILLDFPGLRYGQEVCLCWRQGEESITAWHTDQSGFSGRVPVEATPVGAWEWCN